MLDVQGLHTRAALFSFLREFFRDHGFLEVDTPIRQPVIIPECNIEPIMADGQYLQTSPELCMKRLLAAGCDKIFQISHCFRKDEIGSRHLEEFTMLEWYRTGEDYHKLMEDCDNLLTYIVDGFNARSISNGIQGPLSTSIERLAAVPEKITVEEAFDAYSPVSIERALAEDQFDELLVEHIEPKLGIGHPTFLMDYPVELASLARVKPTDSRVAERFELYVDGIELANGFSELTDAIEQKERFRAELETIRQNRERNQEMPERFLKDVGKIHSAAGIALGVDRLLMLLTGNTSIDDVVTFGMEDF